MKKFLILLAFAPMVALAQLPCGTTEAVDKSLENNPALLKNLEDLEQFTQNYNQLNAASNYIIPVVVHIVHAYGSENISDAQVHDAIRILNEDFNLTNSDTNQIAETFKPILGNTGFEFRLAKKDPKGNCTNGITRTYSQLTFMGSDNVKALISWDTRKYYNIWVVASIASGAGAYAYYPGTAPSSAYEGVITRFTQFGSIGGSAGSNFSARTMTHETGHYFNLRHTWGNNNNCGTGSCSGNGDLVGDTPPTPGNCLTCNLGAARCGQTENVQNFMDYATCIRMFTAGQSVRMQAAANGNAGSRNNLWTEANLIATGVNDGFTAKPCAPVADLDIASIITCSADSILFKDISYGAAIDESYSWLWEFPGGNPTSSNLQNPKVKYANAGIYDVKLTVSNSEGSTSVERKSHVKVYPSVSDVPTPFYQNFDGSDFPGNNAAFWQNWQINNIDESRNWFKSSQAAHSANYAMAVLTNDFLDANTTYKFRSPSINLTNMGIPEIRYDWAYSHRSGTRDRFRINVSTDCGVSFYTLVQRTATQLNTTPGVVIDNFIPNNTAEWSRTSFDLMSLADKSAVIFEFEFVNLNESTGNFYLDNINIGDFQTSTVDFQNFNFKFYPNPVSLSESVIFSGIEGEFELHISDISGKQIGSFAVNQKHMSMAELGIKTPGVYFLNIAGNEGVATRKLIVTP